jgi:hypothetical protein
MDILKQLNQGAEPCAPTPEDLALIHKLTRKPLPPEELYVFRAVLCDNEIDRDGDCFPVESLAALAKLFVGKTGLFDHSMKANDQLMRVYATELCTDPLRKTSLGEAYTSLVGKVYMLRSESTAELCRQIDAGIKKEVSVSCAVKAIRCSVCGKAMGREGCRHRRGELVDGMPCYARLEEPTDAYEFSFVAVPAQPGAGVVKAHKAAVAATPKERRINDMEALRKFLAEGAQDGNGLVDAATAKALQAELEQLESLAADGRSYRGSLLAKAQRAALVALPGLEEELFGRMCGNLHTHELEAIAETLEKQAGRVIPLRPQLCRPVAAAPAENAGFKLS